jgi:thiol-disulfide isomerase/thioredoxin
MTRPPVDHIQRPPFPPRATWINGEVLRADRRLDRPVLVEFWDFCRPNSIRTLPYLRAWNARYAEAGLRVIGIHSPGFPPSGDEAAVRAAVQRLGIEYPVLVDTALEVWREYDNLGWPARYLFGADGMLADYHFGEGGYAETEAAIQQLLGVDGEPLEPIRPADAPDAPLVVQTDDVAGPWSGPYEAGEVWAVLEGEGTIVVNGEPLVVDHPGAYRLIAHEVSTAGELRLEIGDGVVCHAVCFAPGLAS